MLRPLLLALVVCATQVSLLCAQDWPAWRGPSGDGLTTQRTAPLTWSKDEHIKWRVELDGPGNSTPIVVGDRVFITHAPKDSNLRGLHCYDRATGKLAWKQEVEYAEEEPTHNTNPLCSASPVSDGSIVVAWYGSAGLHAYTVDGQKLWDVDTGKVEHIWGYGSSPILYNNLVVQQVGPGLNAYVAAYDAKTGKEVWRKEYPGMKAAKADEFRGSWSTPLVHEFDGKTVMLLSLPERLFAVDPATGDEVWSIDGLSKLVYASPLAAGDTVVTMCGYGGPALAVETKREGQVDEARQLWVHPKNPQRVGSGVIVDGYVYIVNENGVALCVDLKSGDKKWEKRLGGGNTWSSMALIDGRLYAPTTSGKTFVLEASPDECKVLAENSLGELTRGSLAFSDGEAFVRTYEALYCISENK